MQTRMTKNLRLVLGSALIAALALLQPRTANAAAETTGRVAGYVFDPTGAALSEVPLTITGSALQGLASRTTGDDGRYEFDNLPPGEDYVLEINVPGFTPIKQTGIRVRVGQGTSADVNLTVMTETSAVATYQIIEKVNPVLNADSAQAVAVIDAEKASQTPLFHQVEGMAQQVAGVGPGNRPSTRGGLARHGKFYVDGLDTTDITDGSITAPMNFDAVQNFEIIVGGMDAQYNSMGMITNAVTKSGSNKYTYDINFTFQPQFLAAKNNFPANQPSLFGTYVNNDTPGPGTSFYSPIVNLGGPIIADKLWFFASYQQNFSHKESPLALLGYNENRPTDTTTSLGRLKLTWQPTSKDRVSAALNVDNNVINNSIGFSSVTDLAESRIDRGGFFVLVNYDHNISDSTLFQLQTGLTRKQGNQDPACNRDDAECAQGKYQLISHRDVAINVTDFNSGSISADIQGNYLHEKKWRLQFDPSLSWKMRGLGTHQMKAGVQVGYLIDEQATGVSGDRRYVDRGGVCNESDSSTWAFCNQRVDFRGNQGGSLVTKAKALNFGAFIQDRWNVTRQLTLIPGLRLDVGRLTGDDGNLIAYLPGIGPRFSATFDVFGDRKTLLVGHVGRNNDIGNIFIAQHANQSLTQYLATFDRTTNSFPDCVTTPNQAGCTVSGGPAGRTFSTHSTSLFSKVSATPTVDEASFGIHSEVVQETVLGIDYTYRYYNNLWADEETNRIWDPTGTSIIGYADGIRHSIVNTETSSKAYRRYHGLDLWVQGTPGRWDLLASYTLSFNTGTVSDYFDGFLQNPRMNQFYDGYLPDDQRHTLKGSIAYRTPFGLDIGLRLQYRTGKPLWESYTNPGDTSQRLYRSPRGTGFPIDTASGQPNFNDPNSWTEIRNPDQFNIDLQLRYNFADALRLKQQKVELVLLVVNTLNSSEASAFTDNYATSGNRFGFASSHFGALQAEFIIRLRN